jgi:hypothetical protein
MGYKKGVIKMAMILVYMGMAAVFGFFLSIYFFLYRLHFARPWRLLVASIVGVIMGCIMAVITLLTVWPPVDYRFSAGGMAIIAVITYGVLFNGSSTFTAVSVKKEVEEDAHLAACRIDFDTSAGS